jgi:hypothetical protein
LRSPYAAQKTGDTNIFVEFFPMNTFAFADELKPTSLFPRTAKQPWKPNERN